MENVSKSVKINESTRPQSVVLRTLAKNKEKNTAPPVNTSASEEVRTDSISTRSSDPRPSIPIDINTSAAPDATNRVRRVLAVLKSRRVSLRTAERISSHVTPPARRGSPVTTPACKPPAIGVPLPNSVPRVRPIRERSDDREVYQVPKVPFHENPFYKRYIDI